MLTGIQESPRRTDNPGPWLCKRHNYGMREGLQEILQLPRGCEAMIVAGASSGFELCEGTVLVTFMLDDVIT